MTALPAADTSVTHTAAEQASGPDGHAALRALQLLIERPADVADVLRRQRRDLLQWQDQLQRHSVRLLVQRARIDWGLLPGVPALLVMASPGAAPWAAGLYPHAHAVICRTGCEAEGDDWRDGGQCRRTGEACDRNNPAAKP